jgi:sugar phosphate isomerase/epimerase
MKEAKKITRRLFARSVALAGIGSLALPMPVGGERANTGKAEQSVRENLKLSLNAYSFDRPLRAGTMTISDVLDYCVNAGFEGIDLTGYYFTGYPVVPPDELIYNTKKKAFNIGLDICSTGVRNDFTWSDPDKRAEEKKLVKEWIIVAEKLGASFLRIFTGSLSKENIPFDERVQWIAEDINECAEFGKNHGVVIAVQNHNDFLKTASDVDKLFNLLDTTWAGLMLDIGSYNSPDPYKEIAQNAKYAISWQLKEKVLIDNKQADTDYIKIIAIVRQCGFRGCLPLETLGAGDPVTKVNDLFNKVTGVLKG